MTTNRRPRITAILTACAALWIPHQGHASELSPHPPPTWSDAEAADAIDAFLKRHRGRKAEKAVDGVLGTVQQEAPVFASSGRRNHTVVRSLSRLAAWTPAEDTESGRSSRKKKSKRDKAAARGHVVRAEGEVPPGSFSQVEYRFGRRALVALDDKNRAVKKAIDKGEVVTVADFPPRARLVDLARGCVPGVELQVATILRELDVVSTWDSFAVLLDAWRHRSRSGAEESFYAALDRTAGSEVGLFFFNSMLDEFVKRCDDGSLREAGHDRQVDYIQRAFCSYRQYRAFTEAVAWSMVLPPDAPLPAHLRRYDYPAVAEGLYSTRHVLDILLDHEDGDVSAVVADVRDLLSSMDEPSSLDDPGFLPVSAFNARFQERLAEIVAKSNTHTDTMGERMRASRQAAADEIRAATRAALGA